MLFILSSKIGYTLPTHDPSAAEVFQFIKLVLVSLFAISVALPLRHLLIIAPALQLTFITFTLCIIFWRFGGYWRWGIVVLVVGLPFLIFKGIRKRWKWKNASADTNDFDAVSFDTPDAGDIGDSG